MQNRRLQLEDAYQRKNVVAFTKNCKDDKFSQPHVVRKEINFRRTAYRRTFKKRLKHFAKRMFQYMAIRSVIQGSVGLQGSVRLCKVKQRLCRDYIALHSCVWPYIAVHNRIQPLQPYILLYSRAYYYIAVYNRTQPCIAVHSRAYPYIAVNTLAWPNVAVHSRAQAYLAVHSCTYQPYIPRQSRTQT